MLKPILWNSLSKNDQRVLLQRPKESSPEKQIKIVRDLINKVQNEGDEALFSLTKQFDKVDLNTLRVSLMEFDEAMKEIPPQVFRIFEQIIVQLKAFHEPQKVAYFKVETSPGILCERLIVPIQRVGLYVPAGNAPLVSTVLMLGVPSALATCPVRILCSPPNREGKIDPYILVAARLCGITEVFKIGGAQAIAAMAYGTESIPKVDKIFGPGNRWVTLAKMMVSLDPDGAQLDMPAGPSEVMVIADNAANPQFAAADLLSQAEHGDDSQVVLICRSKAFAQAVNIELEQQIKKLSRASIITSALQNSLCIVVEDLNDAIAIANNYAPEHLILQLKNPRRFLPQLFTAGSIFLGPFSPETVGDYASGANHVLPTAGFSRSCSGLGLMDFMRTMSVQEITLQGLTNIADTIQTLTDIEGLSAHQNAIDIRLMATRGES